MIDEDRIEGFLKDNNLTIKDIKTKNLEYYPSAKVKMKLRYVGDYDTGQYVIIGHFDYDEDGNLMNFDSSEVRFEWLGEMMYKYHNQTEDLYDSPFPEKKPSKKTGKTYLSKEDEKILKDLEPYYIRDEEGHSDLWFDGIDHQEHFKKLAKKYGKSVDGIKKLAQRHDPNNK